MELILVGITSILTCFAGYYVGSMIHSNNKVVISSLCQISAGLMIGVVCFEMLLECLEICNIFVTFLYAILGIFIMILLEIYLEKKTKEHKNQLLVLIAMSAHNIIEGISIGASFVYSNKLGLAILIANILHDIPESIVVGIELNKLKNKNKVIKFLRIIASGSATLLGAFIGRYICGISTNSVTMSIAVASGAMLYIVACELIPEANSKSKDKISFFMFGFGVLLAMLIKFIIK